MRLWVSRILAVTAAVAIHGCSNSIDGDDPGNDVVIMLGLGYDHGDTVVTWVERMGLTQVVKAAVVRDTMRVGDLEAHFVTAPPVFSEPLSGNAMELTIGRPPALSTLMRFDWKVGDTHTIGIRSIPGSHRTGEARALVLNKDSVVTIQDSRYRCCLLEITYTSIGGSEVIATATGLFSPELGPVSLRVQEEATTGGYWQEIRSIIRKEN